MLKPFSIFLKPKRRGVIVIQTNKYANDIGLNKRWEFDCDKYGFPLFKSGREKAIWEMVNGNYKPYFEKSIKM